MMVKIGHSGVQTQELLSASPSLEEKLFALAVAYNPVRLEMAQGADQLEVRPLRIFNRASLLLIRSLWLSAWAVAAGRLPQYLAQLAGEMALLVLPARRPRSYPRAVQIKMTRAPRKVRVSAPLPSQLTGIAVKERIDTPDRHGSSPVFPAVALGPPERVAASK
jgi:hypothetical protein